MSQQIMKLKEYGVVNGGITMPAGDKQHPFSVKKVPLRELLNESRNIFSRSPGSSPLSRDRGQRADANEIRNTTTKPPGISRLSKSRSPGVDTVKLSGTKRQQPDLPSSASGFQPSGNTGANGHLVYVRRKSDTEPGKVNNPDHSNAADSSDFKTDSNSGMKEPKVQEMWTSEPKSTTTVYSAVPLAPQTTQEPKLVPPVCAPVPLGPRCIAPEGISLADIVGKPITRLEATELKSMVSSMIPVQAKPQRSSNVDCKERFLRLQMFLKNCDLSSQDDYIQKLRTLSAAGRSRHAIELERRAIQLLFEEGRELQRMKVLNVLGNALPKDSTSVSAQSPPPLQPLIQRDDKTVNAVKLPFIRSG